MAEILGAVSGGAGLLSLALQLPESVAKLRDLARSYKHAPQDLERLANDIENLGDMLQRLEQDHQAHDSCIDDILRRFITRCQDSVGRIRKTTDRLERKIKKPLGRVFTVFEAKEILQLLEDLERAKSALGLAHDQCVESRRQRDSERSLAASDDLCRSLFQARSMIESQSRDIQQLSNNVVVLTATITTKPSDHVTGNSVATVNREQAVMSTSNVTSRPKSRAYSSNEHESQAWRMKVWFLSKEWQIFWTRATAGWDFQLRTWNVRPSNSPIFDSCWEGTLLEVQKLIGDGKASYYDVDENGSTLLSLALHLDRVDVARYLLQSTESWAVVRGLQDSMPFGMKSSIDPQLYPLFFADMRLDLSDLIMDGSDTLDAAEWLSHISTENLRIILSNLSEPWESRPLATRFEAAMGLYSSCSYSTFRLALGPCTLEEIVDLRAGPARSALHFATHEYQYRLDRDWANMIVELIQLGCDPYGKDNEGLTPFDYALCCKATPRAKLTFLEGWLKLICEARANMEAFRRMLEEALVTGPQTTMWMHRGQIFVVVGALSGPDPSDWDLIGRFCRRVPIWSPLKTPGQVEGYYDKCPELLWEPSSDDECVLSQDILNLRIWRARDRNIFTTEDRAFSLRSLAQQEGDLNYEARFEIFGRCKDDLYLNYVFRDGWRRKTSQRSRSQPPDSKSSVELDIRDENLTCSKDEWSVGLHWHKCRFDSRWRLHERHCTRSQVDRNCMAGCSFDVVDLESNLARPFREIVKDRREGKKTYWSLRRGWCL